MSCLNLGSNKPETPVDHELGLDHAERGDQLALTPLQSVYKRNSLTMDKSSDRDLPGSSSSQSHQYASAHNGAAIMDRSQIGRIILQGPDALDLLDRLSTNQLNSLTTGQGATTAITNAKGRLIDWITTFQFPANTLALTSSGRARSVADWIDKYTIVEEVTTQDLTESTAMIGVMGPSAHELLCSVFATSISLNKNECMELSWTGLRIDILRTDPYGLPNYDLIIQKQSAEALWATLLSANVTTPVVPIGATTTETLRIEAGTPIWGQELSESRNPLEAGLARSISWTKGCYIGQEVVARLKAYDKVQRYLIGFSTTSDRLIKPSSSLLCHGNKVGFTTSSCQNPDTKIISGMGYIRPSMAKEGNPIMIQLHSEELIPATIKWSSESPGYL